MSLTKLKAKALKLGADDFKRSTRKSKKYMVLYRGRAIHFGAAGMSDYTIHKDKDRRARYRSRHRKILTKGGQPAYKIKTQPAFWSWKLLW